VADQGTLRGLGLFGCVALTGACVQHMLLWVRTLLAVLVTRGFERQLPRSCVTAGAAAGVGAEKRKKEQSGVSRAVDGLAVRFMAGWRSCGVVLLCGATRANQRGRLNTVCMCCASHTPHDA
jgi:hypothetical protein